MMGYKRKKSLVPKVITIKRINKTMTSRNSCSYNPYLHYYEEIHIYICTNFLKLLTFYTRKISRGKRKMAVGSVLLLRFIRGVWWPVAPPFPASSSPSHSLHYLCPLHPLRNSCFRHSLFLYSFLPLSKILTTSNLRCLWSDHTQSSCPCYRVS